MHILQHRLASVRRRWRFVVGFRGLCALTALVVGAAALIGLADYYVHLPSLIRAYGLVAILAGGGYVAYRWLAHPLATRCDDLSLALRIEEAYPELNDALASTVQFIEAEDIPGSAAMRGRAIDKACDATSDLDFGRILDRRGMLWCLAGAVAACAVAGHFLWHHPDLSRTALLRLAEPFGHHTWTRINLDNVPTRIAVGQPFPLRGVVEGIVPQQVKIEIEGQHPKDNKFEKRAEKVVPLKIDPKSGAGTMITGLDMTQHRGKFRFRVVGNDGRFPPTQAWHEVEVLPPPAFAMLDGLPSPQIALYPPEYSDLPSPQKLSPGTRHIEVVQGTHIVFRAAIDRPLQAAWIDLKPLDPGVRIAPWLSLFMQSQPADALGVVAAQQAVAGRYPALLDETGKLLQVEFMPWASGSYVLHLVDADGLAKDYEADLRINLDPVPVVQMLRPTSSVSVLPDAEVVFRVLAEDDFFAIRSVYLELRHKTEEGQPDAGPSGPRRLTMYDPALAGWVMSRLMPGPLPAPWVGPELRLRPKRLELAKLLALNNEFKEGDVLLIQACSEDFCNITTPRAPGRSPEIEIRIVGKSDLAKMIDEGLGQVQQELVRLQKLQQDAMDLVKEVEKQKPGQKAMDQLIEAEQVQKQIQERIGNRQDEGLRDQLQKLDQLVKDNKLPPTDAIDNLKQLQTELNRLAQEELPKIDQKLSEARKEMAGTQKQAPDKKQSPLKQAGKLQEQAKNVLDDLARTLDKWADVDVVKHQLRETIANQKKLGKRTEQLKKDQEAMAKEPGAKDAGPKKQEFEENLGQQRQAQDDLAKTTEDLQTRMQKVLDQQDKGGKEFTELGSKVKKAGRMDEKERAEAFRQIAKEARDLADDQKEDEAKETLNELAQDLDQAAKKLESGKMPEDEQNDFQRQANNKVKQAQNQATPGPIKNLKDAVKIGDENNVPQKMRDAAEDLEKPNLDKARANQDEALKNLQEMLAALEGQNDDGLDRLRKKQKDLAKADEDVDKLGKRAKEARNNSNPKERAQELRDLAEEARRNARELARLQEEKASQDLKRAAQLLDNAADKMEQGDQAGAEELEQEAMERIEEARQNLEQFQEELSREQLAKIADRLKGLKERQDAAVERTQELHKKLTARKEWSRGLMQTLDADRMTQEGLAGETRSLQEKIKEAKVFEHVMDKAAKAMEKAAEAMAERKDEAKTRQVKWDDADLKDETRRHEQIAKLQKQAGDRIQRLLDALKEEQVAQEKKDQEQQQQPKDGGGEQEQQARPRPADGIPPMAELKALRAEQMEVNERTKELAQRHPNMNDLPDPARRELTELETEQRRLREIFAGMTAKKEGDMP
jgi:hypothetical protein